MVRFTLSKEERLSSRKAIEKLFREGQSLARYPVRIIWLESGDDIAGFPVRVMFSVSKKKFPGAVQRNRIRRLLREAYRLQKPELYGMIPEGMAFHLAIIFTGSEIVSLSVIQRSLAGALKRWQSQLPRKPATFHGGSNHPL